MGQSGRGPPPDGEMAQVRWTLQALDDLEAVCLFIARDAPQVAALFADRAFRATDRLAEHPRLGRMVSELAIESVREILLGNYRIIYRLQKEKLAALKKELDAANARYSSSCRSLKTAIDKRMKDFKDRDAACARAINEGRALSDSDIWTKLTGKRPK